MRHLVHLSGLLAAVIWLWSPTVLAVCPVGCQCGDNAAGAYSVNCDGVYMDEISSLLNPRTRLLSLRGCGIVELYRDVLQLYPELEFLDISNNSISEIEEGVFQDCENLRVLRLRNNQLRTIKNSTFVGLLNLQELDLSGNRIEKIGRNAFKALNGLIQLNLRNNDVEQLHPLIFSKCVQLRRLYLSANKLSQISSDVLRSLSKLEYLDLSFNLITTIDRAAFQHCISLKDLNLSYNNLRFIHSDLFTTLYWLLKLNLNHNQLNETSSAAFRKISMLNVLDLSGNQFTRLQPLAFDDLEVLDTLLLTHQPNLRSIEHNAFSGLRRLRYLNLSYCHKLEEINENAFEYSDELRVLDLSNCAIKQLHSSLVQWTKINTLNLSGNEFDCDCALLSFLPRVLKRLQSNDRCATPSRLKGHLIADLETYCMMWKGESRISLIIVIILGVAFIIVGVYFLRKRSRRRVVKLPPCRPYIVTPLTFDKNYEISKSSMNLLRRYDPMLAVPRMSDEEDENASYYTSLILPNEADGGNGNVAPRPLECKPTPPPETTIPQPPLIAVHPLMNQSFRVVFENSVPITEL